MATTDHTCKYDEGHVNFLIQYHPKYHELDKHTLEILTQDGLWQRDRLAEIVLEATSNGKLKHQSGDGYDLIQLDENQNQIGVIDVKTVTVTYRIKKHHNKTKTKIYYENQAEIEIKNVHKKNCQLRIICFDPLKNNIRFFIIWEYSDIKTINFSALSRKESKYTNGENGIEVYSIQELAQYTTPEKSKKDIQQIFNDYKYVTPTHLKNIKKQLPGINIKQKTKKYYEIKYSQNNFLLNAETNTLKIIKENIS
jgi:hypothetical protein